MSLGIWVIAVGLNVALNLRCIPEMGAVGAARATAVSYGWVLVCTLAAVELWMHRHAPREKRADSGPDSEPEDIRAGAS